MQISIQNSSGTYDLTADRRFTFLADTDLGQTTRVANEIVNPLADIDYQGPDNWGTLRQLSLSMRIRGGSVDELVANAEWLQDMCLLDDEWWLIVKPTPDMPNSNFRIKKSPLFSIPYNQMSQARHRFDVKVELNAEPYVYGDVQTVLNAVSINSPGSVQISEACGDFPAPLHTHIDCAGASASWISLSDYPRSSLDRHLNDYPHRVLDAAQSGVGGSFAGVELCGRNWDHDQYSGPLADQNYSNPLQWGYVRITDVPKAGSYRILVRVKDNGRNGSSSRFGLFVADWWHEDTVSAANRPSTYREFRIQGTSRLESWVWLDAGEFRTGGTRQCVLWAKLYQNHHLDEIIFLPTDDGMLGVMQYNHVMTGPTDSDFLLRPDDLSWNSLTFDRPMFTIDGSQLTSACCGSGLLLPAGTGSKHILVVTNPDNLNPEVTLSYRPQYAGWARE